MFQVTILLDLHRNQDAGGSVTIIGGSSNLSISTAFSGLSTTLNNRTYYLGQSFTKGVSNPEIDKYSGNMIYVDHRPSITRSSNQRRHQNNITVLINYGYNNQTLMFHHILMISIPTIIIRRFFKSWLSNTSKRTNRSSVYITESN